jgi:uncharacterized protein YjdB
MFDRSCLKALLIAGLALPIASCSNTGLSKIVIAPASVTMILGEYVQFTAYGYYGNGSATVMPNQNITSQVTWNTQQSVLAPVTTAQAPNCAVPVKGVCSGLFLSVGGGTITVSANAPGYGGTVNGGASVTVQPCTSNCNSGGVAEPIAALSITPSTDSVAVVGQTAQFIALGTSGSTGLQQNVTNTIPVDGVNGISWSSSNASVATICTPGAAAPCTSSTNGLATATGTGATQITAIWTNPDFSVQTATATLTVTGTASEPLQSLGITPASQTVLQGQFSQLIAIGTFSSTAPTPGTQNLTNSSTVTWASSNNSVATVTSGGANCATPATNCGGYLKAIGAGTAVLTAIASNPDKSVVTATATINVTASGSGSSEPLVSLAVVPVSQTSLTTGSKANVNFIAIGTTSTGATVNLTATPYTVPGTTPAETIAVATWSSSNPAVASFASSTGGVATPNGAGAAAITAIATNPDGTVVTASAAYTVTPTLTEPIVSLVVLPNSQSSLATGVGANVNFIAIGTTSSGSTVNLTSAPYTVPGTSPAQTVSVATWTSSNPAVASFASNTGGVATPKASGATAITAVVTNPDGTVVTGSASYTVSVPAVTEPYASVAIVPASQTLTTVGQTGSFIAIGTTGTGATVDLTNAAGVTWSANSSGVATLVSNGVFKAVASGVTAITVEVPNPGINGNPADGTVVSATGALTVAITGSPEPLLSMSIVPGTQTVAWTGQAAQFIAIGDFSSSSSTPGEQNMAGVSSYTTAWYSSNPSVATVCTPATATTTANCPTTPGLVMSVGPGATAITAIATNNTDHSAVTASATFAVTGSTPNQITSLTIIPGTQTVTLPLNPSTYVPTNPFVAIGTNGSGLQLSETSSVQWFSSNQAVATVNLTTGAVTPLSQGATTITAQYTNPSTATSPANVVTASAALTVSGVASEPLTGITIYPGTQTVNYPGQTSQLVATGTFSSAPVTQNLTTATGQYQITWISSNPAVATVCTPANASLNIAVSCGGLTPGLVTAVTQGTVAITAVASNTDGSVVTGVAAFTVTNGAAEQMTALTIIPGSFNLSATGQPGQFIAIGTSGATGLQEDVTNSPQLAWESSNATIATICTQAVVNAQAGLNIPAFCSSTAGQAQGASAGTTNITAEYVNPAVGTTPSNVVTATASVAVTATPAAEPLLSITVAPASATVYALDATAQFLAFGTFSTTPTVFDITNGFFHQGFPGPGYQASDCTEALATANTLNVEAYVSTETPLPDPLPTPPFNPQCAFVPVPWASLPFPFVFPVNSAGGPGGYGGLVTAAGAGTGEVVYATAANPDGTVVYGTTGGAGGYATFSCPYAAPTYGTISVTNGNGVTTTTTDYSDLLDPGTCNSLTVGGGLLSTLTVFNASISSTGLNQTNWLITAPSATGTANVLHCGGSQQEGSTGGSVCEATYPTGTTVTLTEVPEPGVNFGGWSSNCTAQGTVTPHGQNSCTVVVGGGCIPNPNTGTSTCTDATNVTVGAVFN